MIRIVAEARSCQTPYCWPMTKTLVADDFGQEIFQEARMIGGSGSDLSNSSKSVSRFCVRNCAETRVIPAKVCSGFCVRNCSKNKQVERGLIHAMSTRSKIRTRQAISSPRRPPPSERRRRRPPPDRQTGTAGEWPPVARRSPPVPATDGGERAPPPRGRVRSR